MPAAMLRMFSDLARQRNRLAHNQGDRSMTGTQREQFRLTADAVREDLMALIKLNRLDRFDFKLINKAFGVPLDCWKPDSEPWQIHCWHEWHDGGNQRWLVSKLDSDFIIHSPESGHCLDVWSRDEQWRVHLWPFHGSANQRWQINKLEDSSFRITSVATGLCLDAWKETDKTIVHPYAWHGGENQRWWFCPVFSRGAGETV